MNSTTSRYGNRTEAGKELAESLDEYKDVSGVVVLALPRGGVVVGVELAKYLNAPLDVFLVRKLGVPGQEELAFGAIASGGIRVLNEHVVNALGLSSSVIERITEKELVELKRREDLYRKGRTMPDLATKTVILTDDGLATGATMRAAIRAVNEHSPGKLVVAVPVAAPDTAADLGREVAELICPKQPEPFFGVGAWYDDFPQITDDQVCSLLQHSSSPRAS